MVTVTGGDDGSGVVVQPPLSQAVGYVVVVVIGLVIAFGRLCPYLICIISVLTSDFSHGLHYKTSQKNSRRKQ